MRFDESLVQWHFAVWEWLLRNFGGVEEMAKRMLVLPEKKFFPDALTNDHEGVSRIFARVKGFMDIADWPCHLEPLDDLDTEIDRNRREFGMGEYSTQAPAGTFQWTEEGVAIRYSTRETQNVVGLVATLSHELCHYLLATVQMAPPGGWDDHEFHTDIACAFMGFGIFQCNSAFTFQQWGDSHRQGWSYSRKGYLSESEHAYGLAIFCVLTNTEPSGVMPYLGTNARANFTLALQDLSNRQKELAALGAIRGGPEAIHRPAVFPDVPRGGSEEVEEGSPTLSLEHVKALTFRDPEKEAMWKFYVTLLELQSEEEWPASEFKVLDRLPSRLRDAVLVVRFELLQRAQGLQGAVLMETPDIVPDSEKMLGMTAAAYERIGGGRHSQLLRSMIPGIQEHLRLLEEAQREERLDEFVSPLDRDDEWLELGPTFVQALRRQVRDHAEEMVFPPR